MSMLTYYQAALDNSVRDLARAIERGAGPSFIAILENQILRHKEQLDRETIVASGGLPKGKRETFVQVRYNGEDTWFIADKVLGKPHDGKPYFLGVGQGFDILRILVYSTSANDALEVAEEKLPKHVHEDSEIRIQQQAMRVEKGVSLGGGDARLVSGQDVRYT